MAEFRLKSVLAVAKDREEKARQHLEKSLAEQAQAEAQLEQLITYLDDYQQRQRSGIVMTPFQWQGYQDFLIRVQQAIEIQQSVCEQAQKNTANARLNYQKHQRFLKAMELLKDRHDYAEFQKQEKTEQKLLDEFAMRRSKRGL